MQVQNIIISMFMGALVGACAPTAFVEAGPDAGPGASIGDPDMTGDPELEPRDEVCEDGFEDLGGGCVAISACASGPCGSNETCSDDGGEAVCTCNAGFLTCGERCVGAPDVAMSTTGIQPTRSCGTIASCYGQTFMAPADGWLTSVRHASSSASNTMLEVYIGGASSCTPSGELLLAQVVKGGGDPMADIVLDTPIRVDGGGEYTLKFVGDSDGWIHTCETNDSYKNGHALASMSWDIGFEVSVSSCP